MMTFAPKRYLFYNLWHRRFWQKFCNTLFLLWQTPIQNYTWSPWRKFSLPQKLGCKELPQGLLVQFFFNSLKLKFNFSLPCELWILITVNLHPNQSSSPHLSVGLLIKLYDSAKKLVRFQLLAGHDFHKFLQGL